ncbi:Uma2 family endonuclease [Actinocrispum sp. NPDC049592]|uniref:Uma2 family endonuclease n=1 Tax=Actinocrispum sp. NPDC049592 TaxID=3154835 RepID=UPI003425758A
MAAAWPDHLLTLEEFDALPEDNTRRYELQEGVLIQSAFPPRVRVPDIVVVPEDPANDTVSRFNADRVLLAVEVISPGSRVTDTATKPAEYAAAGIPHYWVIDIEGTLSLTAYHLAGDLGYRQDPPATKRFTTAEPFQLDIDLTTLQLSRREFDGRVDQ